MNQNKQDIEQSLKSLEKVTTELANNLEIAHGVRTCKVCGHTPEVMYKEVEKLVLKARQEAVEEKDKHVCRLGDSSRFFWSSKDMPTIVKKINEIIDFINNE